LTDAALHLRAGAKNKRLIGGSRGHRAALVRFQELVGSLSLHELSR
jgi:hypothetical protein